MISYEELGVTPLINADAHLTALGGSTMPDEVIAAMQRASKSFVDVVELQESVGRRIADLTHNEACYVSSGAAAGIVLSVLACRTGDDVRLVSQLPDRPPKREVIIHSSHRIPYDPAVRLAGGQLVTIGNAMQTFFWELEAAINDRTAAVLFVAGTHLAGGSLSLEDTVAIAHRARVPVIVDAAAQLPPIENLWHFTRNAGADIALFSGGKALGGPQPTGLILGRSDLIRACAQNGAPHQRFARAMKTGKEEMLGLLAAVDRYLKLDHQSLGRQYEQTVAEWIGRLADIKGVVAERAYPNEAAQPIPRLRLRLDAAVCGMFASDLVAKLRAGHPPIAIAFDPPDAVLVTPDMLCSGEDETIACRLRDELGRRGEPQ